jgi:predicted TIM-barrel fold metal-dependent hydrolase
MSGPDRDLDYGFVDVNTQIGPEHGEARGAPAASLTRERRSHGVRHTLTRHRTALHAETRVGNRELLAAAELDDALLPIAVLAAARSDTLDEATGLGNRVAGFWLDGRASPGNGSVATDELVRAAAKTGKPLIAAIATYGDASRIGAATADLGVPVVLSGWHYNNSVDTLAAARRWPHLHVETSGAAHFGAIDVAVRQIGHERVLYGSGAPFRGMQSSINAILTARIPDDQKRAILGENAARIFGVPMPRVTLPEVARPKNVDTHAHSGPLPWDAEQIADTALQADLRRQTGNHHVITSSILAIAADTEAGNGQTVALCKANPNHFGNLVADPNDIEATRDQIRRWGAEPGIVGVKVHCEWSHRHTSSSQIWDLFNVLADYGKPVKIHNDGPDWDAALLRIAREHPKLPILIAHGGMGFPDLPGARLTVAADNIYLEMCSSFAMIPTVREVVRTIPRHKFLFGTDAPLLDGSFVLGTYQDAEIPADQQDAVYFDNAAALYGLPS